MTNKTGTDLRKSLFSEGEWHLVPAEYVNSWVSMDRESVIVHQCPEWTVESTTEAGLTYDHIGYWATSGSVDVRCKLCNHSPPEAIARLFLLHNFDSFAKDGYDRWLAGGIDKAFVQFDRMHVLGEHYTEIGVDE